MLTSEPQIRYSEPQIKNLIDKIRTFNLSCQPVLDKSILINVNINVSVLQFPLDVIIRSCASRRRLKVLRLEPSVLSSLGNEWSRLSESGTMGSFENSRKRSHVLNPHAVKLNMTALLPSVWKTCSVCGNLVNSSSGYSKLTLSTKTTLLLSGATSHGSRGSTLIRTS